MGTKKTVTKEALELELLQARIADHQSRAAYSQAATELAHRLIEAYDFGRRILAQISEEAEIDGAQLGKAILAFISDDEGEDDDVPFVSRLRAGDDAIGREMGDVRPGTRSGYTPGTW